MKRSATGLFGSHLLINAVGTVSHNAYCACEQTRDEFKLALELTLFERPDLLVLVDETHRDRNASRRRRGYGRRNGGGLKFRRWFRNEVRFTLIGVDGL